MLADGLGLKLVPLSFSPERQLRQILTVLFVVLAAGWDVLRKWGSMRHCEKRKGYRLIFRSRGSREVAHRSEALRQLLANAPLGMSVTSI